jgi:hypothetical protein
MEYVTYIDEAGDEDFGKLVSRTRPFCPLETWLSLPKPKRGCCSQAINTPHFSLLSVSSSSQGKPRAPLTMAMISTPLIGKPKRDVATQRGRRLSTALIDGDP